MVTRARDGISKPNPKYAMTATTPTISPVPTSVRSALKDPHWLAAMQDEHNALLRNRTWTLVDRPPGARVISGKWVFKHKLNADGSLERYKARWVVKGLNQCPGVSLYGLRQAPRAWFTKFSEFVISIGFSQSCSDSSLSVLHYSIGTVYLLLYVDDMVLSASSTGLLEHIMAKLKSAFAVKDMGNLKYFLGIDIRRTANGFYLSQANYVDDILERAGMSNCKPVATPADTRPKTSMTDGKPIADASFYRSMAGALQYLTVTRPDITFAVQQTCLHMHSPTDVHLAMLKCILRYVKGTPTLSIALRAAPSPELTMYSDADWAGRPDTKRSTSGFCVFYGDALISWSSKRQTTVSRSSAEAEYRGVANAVAECSWLRHLLGELHSGVSKATIVFCDNVSAVYMTRNPVHHKLTKHIELDIRFVREKVGLGEVRVVQVPSARQLADVFTKGCQRPSSMTSGTTSASTSPTPRLRGY
jgi:hypothetical protein